MVLFWTPPRDLGGCRVTGYAVFRDDGAVASSTTGAGITTELNTPADPAIRDLPSLNTIAATNWPAGTEGQAFRLQVQAFTTQRDALSAVTNAILAAVPSKPTDVPLSDPAVTSESALKVTYGTPPPADNGSPIISYELQMDDGLGGGFVSLVGFSPYTMIGHFTVS